MTYLLKTLSIAVVIVALSQSVTRAQCATCPTTVAVAPVVTQTVAVPQPTGWYPGALFDRLRMNRWFGQNAAASTYAATATTAAYSPYTASYAPATTAAYTPYVSAYAPLQTSLLARPAVQTSYYRPVVMRPVIEEPVSTCVYQSPTCCPASPCSSCASGVSAAVYSEPASDCVGCAASASTTSYSSSDSQGHAGPPTPTPALKPDTSSRDSQERSYQEWEAGYRAGLEAARDQQQRDSGESILRNQGQPADPGPAPAESTGDAEAESTSNYPGYPKLFVPSNDRTAQRRPTVDVHQAVYRRDAAASRVSTRTPSSTRSQAELDAAGWQSPSR